MHDQGLTLRPGGHVHSQGFTLQPRAVCVGVQHFWGPGNCLLSLERLTIGGISCGIETRAHLIQIVVICKGAFCSFLLEFLLLPAPGSITELNKSQ